MTNGHGPAWRDYIENAVFLYLTSLKESQELQESYRQLDSQIKSASTMELHRIARRATQYFMDNTHSVNELAHLPNETLILEALLQAIEDDD